MGIFEGEPRRHARQDTVSEVPISVPGIHWVELRHALGNWHGYFELTRSTHYSIRRIGQKYELVSPMTSIIYHGPSIFHAKKLAQRHFEFVLDNPGIDPPASLFSDLVPVVADESRESRMVVLRRDERGRPSVWCDPEIADIVGALCSGGVPTVASCSGHGHRPGSIVLADGRELLIVTPEQSSMIGWLHPLNVCGELTELVPEGMEEWFKGLMEAGDQARLSTPAGVDPLRAVVTAVLHQLRGVS